MKLKVVTPLLFALTLFCNVSAVAQTITPETPKPDSKMEAGFEGMVGLSAGKDIVALNVGGPSLKYRVNPNFKIGFGAFPSLIVMDKKVFPKLAFSPIVEHKKWLFIAPYYGYNAEDKMIWTVGLGYRF